MRHDHPFRQRVQVRAGDTSRAHALRRMHGMVEHAHVASTTAYGKQFTTDDVTSLGKMLIEVADRYPLQYLTERDFFPLVCAYMKGRVPRLHPEVAVDSGAIDFRIGGSNPSVIELAVAPRAFADPHAPATVFPGHSAATQLYATQNGTELKKLSAVPQSRAKMRYLLLVDFRSAFEKAQLKALYEKTASTTGIANPVKVVYVARNNDFVFTLRRR